MTYVVAASKEGSHVHFEILDIDVLVPPRAATPGKLIKISIITNVTKYISFGEHEMSVAFVIECMPDGLKLNEPLLATIPHCVSLGKAGSVQPVLHLGHGEGGIH